MGVACFYSDFATQKEQSSMNMLGVRLKQIVGTMGVHQKKLRKLLRTRNRL